MLHLTANKDTVGIGRGAHISNGVATGLLTVFVFLLWKIVSHLRRWNQERNPENGKEIPGPWGLPIIGNLHQLGRQPHKDFFDMAERYGDVFSLNLGSHPVVILSRRTAIHEALIKQTTAFAGRPAFLGFLEVLTVRGGGIAFTSYSKGWKIHREMVDTAFLDFSNGNQIGILESYVTLELNDFLKFVLNDKQYVSCEPKNLLRLAVANIMTNLLFKNRREFENPDLQKLIDDNDGLVRATKNANVLNFMPWLRGLFGGRLRNVKTATLSIKTSIDTYIEESLKGYKPGSKSDVLHYLKTLGNDIGKETLNESEVNKDAIQASVYDIFGAGYDTISATLMWAFIYLVNFPELQKEMQDEIDNVVGRDGLPAVADREKLPLTEAFIAEVFRHVSVVPFAVPHKTIQDTVLGAGYNFFIPKDTIVFMSLYSIHNDPEQWDNPAIFNPKRFLLEGGGGLDKKKVSSVMQLGGGLRRCVGFNVAPIILLLFISNVLHQCTLKSFDGQKLSTTGTSTAVLIQPPNCELEFERRL